MYAPAMFNLNLKILRFTMKREYIAPLSIGIAFSAEPILASGTSGINTYSEHADGDYVDLSRRKSSSDNPIWKDMK